MLPLLSKLWYHFIAMALPIIRIGNYEETSMEKTNNNGKMKIVEV